MSILKDITNIDYNKMSALCEFTKIINEAIKTAVKKLGYNFESDACKLEYWNNEKNICYGAFFPNGASGTELKFWVGLHWDKDAPEQVKIVFYVYVPVNMLFMRQKIVAQLKSAENSDKSNSKCYKPSLHDKQAVELKEEYMTDILKPKAENSELKSTLTSFILEVLKDLEKLLPA